MKFRAGLSEKRAELRGNIAASDDVLLSRSAVEENLRRPSFRATFRYMEEDSIPRVFGQAAWTVLKGILACFYLPVATAVGWIVIHYVL